MVQSNPIQQRVEWMADLWNEIRKQPGMKAAVYRVHNEEQDMIEALFAYFLGIDSIVQDIAIHFETPINEVTEYSNELLAELNILIDKWNRVEKSENLDFVEIIWQPDSSDHSVHEPAKMFVENMNSFAKSLDLKDDVYLVAILLFNNSNAGIVNKWFNNLLKQPFHPQLKIIVTDTFEELLFDDALITYEGIIELITPELNMPQAMEQLAAMGNADDPETQYRIAFTKLSNAVAKKDDEAVQQHTATCLKLANIHINKNPYWVMQLVTIYMLRGTYYVGLRNFDQAVKEATMATEAGKASIGLLTDEAAFRIAAQGLMFRGSLYFQRNKLNLSKEDFHQAATYYKNCDDTIMLIEALRMEGFISGKMGLGYEKIQCLEEASRLGIKINEAVAEASSYPLVLKELLNLQKSMKMSYDELSNIASPLFGIQWETRVQELTELPK